LTKARTSGTFPDLHHFEKRGCALGEKQMPRIVIVEDDTQVLTLAESILQQAGYDTVSASTVAEAQALINSKHASFDLVFTDVELGNHKEGGLTIGKLLGDARKGTPVLYTSGRPLTDGMQSLFAEPSAFLPKPYTVDQLTEAVAELLRIS
jgi:DNA-binding NtrC family response regulator